MKKKGLTLFVIICILILLISGCTEKNNNSQPNNQTYDLFVDDNYNINTIGWQLDHFSNITDALINSKDNYSIFVHRGHYNETLIIDKSISLHGEDPYTTIIDGQSKIDDVIFVEESARISLSGFRIQNTGNDEIYVNDNAGLDLRSSGNKIKKNIFINNTFGVCSKSNGENNITDNMFFENIEYAMYINSHDNSISNNIFDSNDCGIRVKGARNSIIFNNVFIHNRRALYFCCGAEYNIVFGNIFYNNSKWDMTDFYENNWDTTIPSKWHQFDEIKLKQNISDGPIGNYWDNFHEETQGAYDNDSDGIIDSPYPIPKSDNFDEFPLAEMPAINNSFYANDDFPDSWSLH